MSRTVIKFLQKQKDFRLLISPDHYTPIKKRTHTANPVPFLLCGKGIASKNQLFNEKNAGESPLVFNKGHELMPYFLFGENAHV